MSAPASSSRHDDDATRSRTGNPIAEHPVTAFLVLAIGLTWIVQIASILLLGDITPGILAELVILLGAAVLVTGVREGGAGLRLLFGRVLRWRVGAVWYVVAVIALPVLTILIALATGTFREPAAGWGGLLSGYLLQTLLIGALLGNIWEELAWTGVVQRRLMDRHGLLGGSLLTAIPFALIHLPMVFGAGFAVPLEQVLLFWGVLLVTAPFLRYLIGMTYAGTGGSLLLVGLLHASFNASGSLPAFVGFGQQIAALVVLLAVVAGYRAVRMRRGGEEERRPRTAIRHAH